MFYCGTDLSSLENSLTFVYLILIFIELEVEDRFLLSLVTLCIVSTF